MLGAERKSMVMKEEERRLTAYHEAGHALCAIKVEGNDPLHKVTIVPRGRALGLAFTLPEDDRVSITRQQLEAMLVMTYGGRTAEELVFGYDRVTTGASSDIQKATSIARRYVTQWGLSDAIGPILVGDNEQELFLGREIQHRREVSRADGAARGRRSEARHHEAYDRAKAVLEREPRPAAHGGGRAARARDADGARTSGSSRAARRCRRARSGAAPPGGSPHADAGASARAASEASVARRTGAVAGVTRAR